MAAWNDSNTGYMFAVEFEELDRILISVAEGSVGIQVSVPFSQAKDFLVELESAVRKIEERKIK
jgi:hypothetical protein